MSRHSSQPGPRTDVTPGRRLVYHAGQVLTAIGIMLFLSVFFSLFSGMGGSSSMPLPGQGDALAGAFLRAPVGLVLAVVGGALMNLGRRGVAGSGLTLDPQGTRADEEPWNRARGGMLEDALDASPTLKGALTSTSGPAIKLRCRACQALNDEQDKFCGQCGKPL